MFLLLKPSDQPFHSPVSFNVISIAGIHFAYISCCLVRQARASYAVVKNNLLLTEYAWNLNTLRKSPIGRMEYKAHATLSWILFERSRHSHGWCSDAHPESWESWLENTSGTHFIKVAIMIASLLGWQLPWQQPELCCLIGNDNESYHRRMVAMIATFYEMGTEPLFTKHNSKFALKCKKYLPESASN